MDFIDKEFESALKAAGPSLPRTGKQKHLAFFLIYSFTRYFLSPQYFFSWRRPNKEDAVVQSVHHLWMGRGARWDVRHCMSNTFSPCIESQRKSRNEPGLRFPLFQSRMVHSYIKCVLLVSIHLFVIGVVNDLNPAFAVWTVASSQEVCLLGPILVCTWRIAMIYSLALQLTPFKKKLEI